METVKCPSCGRTIYMIPNPDKPGWLVARCHCNVIGPVMETPEKPAQADTIEPPAAEQPAKGRKENK